MTLPLPDSKAAARRLVAWYDRHHRALPWRVAPPERRAGVRPDPYRVWLSEIMLQQTTVAAVKSYFLAFTQAWPTVQALAAADEADVMKAWAGLGYYSRARNLKKAADSVAASPGGVFPDTEDGLRALPGVGAYTAAAIAAIAFERPSLVVDGNVERVVARLGRISTPLPKAKAAIRARLSAMMPTERFGDFAQGMMDLGATVCTPKRPACSLCPLNRGCEAYAAQDQEAYPVKPPKPVRPLRSGSAYVAVRDDGAVLLRRRAPKGLLGGMSEPPTTDWTAARDGVSDLFAGALLPLRDAAWAEIGEARHGFTHFELRLRVFCASFNQLPPPVGTWWSSAADLPGEALPSVMKKVIEAAIPGATKRQQA